MALIFFVVAFILFAWSLNRWKSRVYVRLAKAVPSNKWNTMLGWGKFTNANDVISDLHNHSNKYGPNSVFWMGPNSFFLSKNPQTLKEILTSKNCTSKPSLFYDGIAMTIGQGLLSENQPTWGQHRKLFNKAYSHTTLVSFLPIFYREIDNMIQKIQKSVKNEETVDMFMLFRILTIQNSTQTILQKNYEFLKFTPTMMVENCHRILEYVAEIITNPIMNVPFIRKIAENFIFKTVRNEADTFNKFIEESLETLIRNDTKDPSFIPEINSALKCAIHGAQQNVIKMEEIKGEMMHLFFASFETLATTLYLVLTLLAMHPYYQERVYNEVVSIVHDDNEITIEQIEQMVYLDMIFNETMRIFPVVPIVLREVSSDDLELSNGLTLPVGQVIIIDIYSLHRCKDIWGPEANTFNPDNFLPSNVALRHPYAFIPFTKGQRYCLGVRYAQLFVKIALAKFIKHFKFSTDFKFEDLKVKNNMTLSLLNKPLLKLEQRES